MYRESHARSIAKAVSWRLLGTLTTSAIVLVFTHRVTLSLAIGVIEFGSKIGLFWLHERLWDRVQVGKRETRPAVVWLTGLSGSGKSTIAAWITSELARRGFKVEHLDGDGIRQIFPQTGFTREERDAHVRRVGYLASKLERHGVIVVVSLISPYRESRDFVRSLCDNFVEVHVATPLDECERRDVKGLYARARRGEITRFTGIDDPYEAPEHAELTLDTRFTTIEQAGALVLQRLDRLRSARRKHHGSTGSPERARGAERSHPAGSVRELQTAGDAVVDR